MQRLSERCPPILHVLQSQGSPAHCNGRARRSSSTPLPMYLSEPQRTIDMASQRNLNGRVVHGIVDKDGTYFSRVAAGGPYVFFASPAVDNTGSLAAEARVKPPYHNSASANVRARSRYIWQRYKEA